MKIAVVTPYKKLDYLAETIIEGLYRNEIEIRCSCPGNGVRNEDVLPEDAFYEYAKSADYIFAIWSKKKNIYPGVDYMMIKNINRPDKTIFIDGSEWTFTGQPEQGQVAEAKYNPLLRRGTAWINTDMLQYCKWYFKRECYPQDAELGIIPLLYGATKRNFGNYELLEDKTIDIFCGFGQINDGLRKEAVEVCKKLKSEGYNVITDGNYDYETYKKMIISAYITIDAWGGGDCCARLWEIFANKSCAFSQKYNIIFPDKFKDGESVVEFTTKDELETKLRYYLNRKDECIRIGNGGYNHLLKYHTPKKRVEYMLKEIM